MTVVPQVRHSVVTVDQGTWLVFCDQTTHDHDPPISDQTKLHTTSWSFHWRFVCDEEIGVDHTRVGQHIEITRVRRRLHPTNHVDRIIARQLHRREPVRVTDWCATLVPQTFSAELVFLIVKQVDTGRLRFEIVDCRLLLVVVVLRELCIDVGHLANSVVAWPAFQCQQLCLNGGCFVHIIVDCGATRLLILHALVHFLPKELLVPHQNLQAQRVKFHGLP